MVHLLNTDAECMGCSSQDAKETEGQGRTAVNLTQMYTTHHMEDLQMALPASLSY